MSIYSLRQYLRRTVQFLYLFPMVAASLTLLPSCSFSDDDYMPPSEKDNLIHIGDALPPFTVTDSGGNRISTQDLLGQPAVLVFFNTSCGDCQRELPVLQRFYEEYGNNVRFLCISREEGEASIKDFWEKHALTLPYSAQTDRTIYSLFALQTIPRIYVADAKGIVRNFFIEGVDQETLRQNLDSLTEEGQSDQLFCLSP